MLLWTLSHKSLSHLLKVSEFRITKARVDPCSQDADHRPYYFWGPPGSWGLCLTCPVTFQPVEPFLLHFYLFPSGFASSQVFGSSFSMPFRVLLPPLLPSWSLPGSLYVSVHKGPHLLSGLKFFALSVQGWLFLHGWTIHWIHMLLSYVPSRLQTSKILTLHPVPHIWVSLLPGCSWLTPHSLHTGPAYLLVILSFLFRKKLCTSAFSLLCPVCPSLSFLNFQSQ